MNSGTSQTPLVVVGGWATDAAMLLPLFDSWPGEIHLVSINDALVSRCESITQVADYLLARYPCPSIWAGWSQGSQVVMAAAARGTAQVSKVITLAGFPRFVAGPGWPTGMAVETFEAFRAGIASQADQAWKRFQHLLVHGCDDRSKARSELRPWLERGPSVCPQNLLRGLDWLESEDQLWLWSEAEVPALHLQAGKDALVRPWAGNFTPSGTGKVVPVPDMTHWPRGPAVAQCRDAIRQFALGEGGACRT